MGAVDCLDLERERGPVREVPHDFGGRRRVESGTGRGRSVLEDADLISTDRVAAVVGRGLPLQGDGRVVRLGQDSLDLGGGRRVGDGQPDVIEKVPARPGAVGEADALDVRKLALLSLQVGGLVDAPGGVAARPAPVLAKLHGRGLRDGKRAVANAGAHKVVTRRGLRRRIGRLHLEPERHRGAEHLLRYVEALVDDVGAVVRVLAQIGGVRATVRVDRVDELVPSDRCLRPRRGRGLRLEAAVINEGVGHTRAGRRGGGAR